jgi:RHS repeat-associated protein
MRNYSQVILTLAFSITLANTFAQKKENVDGVWSGTVSVVEKFNDQYLGDYERHVNLKITNNEVTGTHTNVGKTMLGGVTNCSGTGKGELVLLSVRSFNNTYGFNIIIPKCEGEDAGTGMPDIGIGDQKLTSPTVLSGTESIVKNPGEITLTSTYSRTTTWRLVRTSRIDEPCKYCGSVVSIENQSLGQAIAIAGTPFTLNYRSDGIHTDSSVALGGWTLSPHHNFMDNQLYLGDGTKLAAPDDLNAIAAGITGIVPPGGFLIASADGSEMYAFGSDGRHLRILDPLTGKTIYEFKYDADKRLIAIADLFERTTRIERNAAGIPTAIIGPYGHTTNLVMDNDHLLGVIDPQGAKVSFAYSPGGMMTKMTDPRNITHVYEYDKEGRLTRESGPSTRATTITRSDSDNGFTIDLVSAQNHSAKYAVLNKPDGIRERTITFPDGTSNKEKKWPDGHEMVKFASGMVEIRTASSRMEGGHRSPFPDSVITQLPGGLTSIQLFKRSIAIANPLNPLSVSTLTDKLELNGNTAQSVYTADNRTLTELSPLGRMRTTIYDDNGQVIKRTITGLIPTVYQYDQQGRPSLTKREDTETRQYAYAYNATGGLDRLTDPSGNISSYQYDADNRITRISLPGGSVIGFTYDKVGNITAIKPPGRPSHSFEYNDLGLLSRYTAPSSGKESSFTTYEYNADKQLIHITRPDGRNINFSYDISGCQCGKIGSFSEPRGLHNYTYDKSTGLLSGITSPGNVALSFNYVGDVPSTQTWSGPVKASVKEEYDNNFRVVSRTVNGTASVTYKTDEDGLLIKAGDMTLERRKENGLITGTKLGKITETKLYNLFGEKIGSIETFNEVSLYSAKYERDKLGRISAKIETISGITDSFKYDYDGLGRLTSVTKGKKINTYRYDENGNRLAITRDGETPITATYDDQDRLLQYGNIACEYNANGDLLRKTEGPNTTKYDYDVLGNLISVSLPDAKSIEYIVDGLNRRIGRKLNGVLTKGYIYQDELRIVAELDAGSNIKTRFVYASRMNVPDFMIRDGLTYRIISDNTGSPRLIVDISTGNIAQRMDYDEFGNVIDDSNPGFQPFGFAGGLYDPDTKLTRFGARDYDAQAGRWTTRDPVLFAAYQTNLYAYVGNDPLNQKDPTGRGVRVCWGSLLTIKTPKTMSHWWLETNTVKRGMGNPRGGAYVEWVDQEYKYHQGETIQCEDYPTVDEDCVNQNTQGDLGIYIISNGTCQTVVKKVLEKCDKAPKSPPPPSSEAPFPIRRGSY